MEPRNNKYDFSKGWSYSYSIPSNQPVNRRHGLRVNLELLRMDSIDRDIDTMTSYPEAEAMLNKLFSK